MTRLNRVCLPGIPHHLIQRGVDRHPCFASEEDFSAYFNWLTEYSVKYRVAIHAWVFMTNHVHLLATPATIDGNSRLMQDLGRQYVRYFNHRYQRTGTLWEGRFRSSVIDSDNYLLICQRYIELNPVRAKIVTNPAEYLWSSFHCNGFGTSSRLHTPHPLYLRLGHTMMERTEAYREFFSGEIKKEDVKMIQKATNRGLVVGNDHFAREIEALCGRRVTPQKPGPKSKV